MKKTIKRKHHHFSKWEEHKHGMWNVITGKKKDDLLIKAIEFTGNAELYGKYMMRVATEWKHSCDENLSNKSLNRQAWIGHAACCLAIGCPESITREAWHHLSQEQQDRANKKADEAILFWETNRNTPGGESCPSGQLELMF
jgi:hypothetical protein